MKLILNCILVLTSLFSYSQKNKEDFQNQIRTVKTDEHVRVKGTKNYLLIPDEYQYVKELARYQKNENTYVQIIETNTSNFSQSKSSFTREGIEAKGAKVHVLKNIKLNKFEAIYLEGPSKYPNETKLSLIFGDETFFVMIVGVCKSDDLEGKKELQKILKSVYYDKSLQIDPLELANFEFDASITNFKYAATASNIFMYSDKGKDGLQDPDANILQITIMPEMTDEDAAYFANDLLWRYEKNGLKLKSKNIIKTSINNRTAYELESKVNAENKEGMMYQVVLLFEGTTIVLMATASSDQDNYLAKFKETAKSIKIK
jgi:hypothetical protein